jgi:hypothetical protein
MSDLSALQASIAALALDLTSLRADLDLHRRDPQLHTPRPLGVPHEDLQRLTTRVPLKPPLTLHQARAQFGAEAVDAAIQARMIYRSRPDGGTVVLTTDPPRPSSIDIPAYLRESITRIGPEGPLQVLRGYASMNELRNVFNKNTVTLAVEDALRRKEIAIGHMKTARPGRPPRVVILHDLPRPTHVDGLPVRWES